MWPWGSRLSCCNILYSLFAFRVVLKVRGGWRCVSVPCCMSLRDIFSVGGGRSAAWDWAMCWSSDLPRVAVMHPLSSTTQLWPLGLWLSIHRPCFLYTCPNLPPAWIILYPYEYVCKCYPPFSVQTHRTISMQLRQSCVSEASLPMSCPNTLSTCCFMTLVSILHCRLVAHFCSLTFSSREGKFPVCLFLYPQFTQRGSLRVTSTWVWAPAFEQWQVRNCW